MPLLPLTSGFKDAACKPRRWLLLVVAMVAAMSASVRFLFFFYVSHVQQAVNQSLAQ